MSNDFNNRPDIGLRIYDGLEEAPCNGERFLIPGPTGVLEALMVSPPEMKEGDAIAVICHPHPLYGGSMANKVVHVVANTLNDMGMATLRFNFRGVGHSQGHFDNGKGEVDDLVAATQWFKQRYVRSPLWLAGFSFGSYIAFQAHQLSGANRLMLIAPPVTMFDFNADTQIQIPWMVIQGGRDEITEPEKVSAWVKKQSNKPSYQWLSDADHFFHGQLNHIRNAIRQEWS